MKKTPRKRAPRPGPDDILPEYNFRGGRRNQYAARLGGAPIVVVDADLAPLFPTAAAVNEALRALAGIIGNKRKAPVTKSRSRATRRAG